MTRPLSLAAEVAQAEQRVAQRRTALRREAMRLAARTRRRMSSPGVMLAAAGVGFLLASRRGRRGIGKVFSGAQLVFALLSAARG